MELCIMVRIAPYPSGKEHWFLPDCPRFEPLSHLYGQPFYVYARCFLTIIMCAQVNMLKLIQIAIFSKLVDYIILNVVGRIEQCKFIILFIF